MVKSQKLTYIVVIMTIILLFYTMITKPFHNYTTVHIQGGNNDVLQIRAKASWFSKHPEPVQTIKYKHETLAKNTDEGESVWDNLLDLKYWSSFSYDDDSELDLEEYWADKQTIKYKHEALAENKTRTEVGESVWDNLLDLKYWSSFSYDDDSEIDLEEYWADKQTIKYKHEALAENKTRTEVGESVWDNLLDLKYRSSFSYDDESELDFEEYWADITNEIRENKARQRTIDVMNRSTVDLSCPERKPVRVTDDGRRQIPKELYNMAAQVRY